MDFSANKRLRSLIFNSIDFDDFETKQCVLCTLRTTGKPLERITFNTPMFHTLNDSDAFFEELDGLLTDKSVFHRLTSVRFHDLAPFNGPGIRPEGLEVLAAKLERWLPRLYRRGILFIDTCNNKAKEEAVGGGG